MPMSTAGVMYDEPRTEMLDGIAYTIGTKSTNHGIAVAKTGVLFTAFFKGKHCVPFTAGLDVHFTRKDRVKPDVMVVCDWSIIKENGVYGVPDLVVEVVSRSSVKRKISAGK